ncbi:MAG: hypothetical protein RLO51_16295 [Thalassobaculum sp.]
MLERRVRAIGGRNRQRSDLLAISFRNPVIAAGRLAGLAVEGETAPPSPSATS